MQTRTLHFYQDDVRIAANQHSDCGQMQFVETQVSYHALEWIPANQLSDNKQMQSQTQVMQFAETMH